MSTGGKIGALLIIFFVVIVLSGLTCVIHERFIEPAEAEESTPVSSVDFSVETIATDAHLDLVMINIENTKITCVMTSSNAISCDWGQHYGFSFMLDH